MHSSEVRWGRQRTGGRTDSQTDRPTNGWTDTRTGGECNQKTKGTGTFSYPGAQSQFHSPGFPATKFPPHAPIYRSRERRGVHSRARIAPTRGWARRSVSVKASLFLSAAPWCPVMAKAIYTGMPRRDTRGSHRSSASATEFIYAPRIPNALIARRETVDPFARARTSPPPHTPFSFTLSLSQTIASRPRWRFDFREFA